ncbi:MAG: MFS transporter [Dehalococcoidia bacterium]
MNPHINIFLVAFFLLGLSEQIAIAHQVYFFRDVGYEPMVAANIYSVFGILFIVGTLCSFLSDRFGREKVFIPSCLLSAGATSLLFLIRDVSQVWMPVLFAVCFGLGLGAAGPVFYSAAADLFHGKHFGSILGVITLGFSLGGALGPPLAGFIHDRTNSYFFAFFIVLGSLVSAALLMWLIAPRKTTPVPGRAGRR